MTGPLDGATGLLVDGRWLASGTELVVTDKYTLRPLAAVQQARPGDVAAAVAAAAEAARHPMPPAGARTFSARHPGCWRRAGTRSAPSTWPRLGSRPRTRRARWTAP